MDRENFIKQIKEITQNTLEEAAFFEAVPSDNDVGLQDISQVFTIPYEKPSLGRFNLVLPRQVKFQIAENIYGEKWSELAPSQIDDSLLEILNVMAGRFLTTMVGPGEGYQMGLPVVSFDIPEPQADSVKIENFFFLVEGGAFRLEWIEGAT